MKVLISASERLAKAAKRAVSNSRECRRRRKGGECGGGVPAWLGGLCVAVVRASAKRIGWERKKGKRNVSDRYEYIERQIDRS